jgi:hypothetical protein
VLALLSAEHGMRAYLVWSRPQRYPAMYAADPLYIHRLRPHFRGWEQAGDRRFEVLLDGEGWRIGAADEPVPEGPRIALVGDSFVFGHLMDYADSLPALLEGRLAADGCPADVRGFGVPGFGPLEYAGWVVPEAVAWQPEVLVIAFYVGNDFREVAVRDEVRLSVLGGNLQELGLQHHTGAIPRWIWSHSVLWRRVVRGFQGSSPGEPPRPADPCESAGMDRGAALYTYLRAPPEKLRTAFDQVAILLERCFAEARAHGVERILLWSLPAPVEYDARLLPDGPLPCGLHSRDFDLQGPERFLADLAARNGVEFLAASDALRAHIAADSPDSAEELTTNVHLSPIGNRVVVPPLAERLEALLAR